VAALHRSASLRAITTWAVTAPPRPKSALLGMWPDFEITEEAIRGLLAATKRPPATIAPRAIFALLLWLVTAMPMPTPTALSGSGSRVAPGMSRMVGVL